MRRTRAVRWCACSQAGLERPGSTALAMICLPESEHFTPVARWPQRNSLNPRAAQMAACLLVVRTARCNGGTRRMPRNGEINDKFGVYKSLCCSVEIVIPEGATFPD